MNALTVLLVLQSVGATIRRDGAGLAIDAPAGAVTPEIREAVAGCRSELLRMLPDPKGGTSHGR